MIPISLTIKGLYSYQREETIHFDRLLEGQLFGIFGAVGSGKSSILEAISFALYGQTERMNSQDNRNYNMMNLKSNELLIDFKFYSHDQSIHRFTVKGKRHGKDFEKVNTYTRSAYQWIDEEWIPKESANAEQIIGLSYDNFRRTIIIPQGKFQEFLQLSYSQRTQMLKEIFQLEKFEFFYQTRNLENKNNSTIQHLSGKLSIYAEITQERIDEKQNQLSTFEKKLIKKKEAFNKKKKEHTALSLLKELLLNKSKQEEFVSKLEEKKEYYFSLENNIKNIEYCFQHFKQELQLQEQNKTNLTTLSAQLETENKSKTALDSTFKNINSELEKLEPEFAKQEYYKEKLKDFDTLIVLLKLKEEVKAAENRILKGEVVLTETIANRGEFENKRLSFKQKIADYNKQMPNVSELIELRTWFDKNVQLTRASDALRDLKAKISTEKSVLDTSLKQQVAGYDFFTSQQGELDLIVLNSQLVVQLEKINQSILEISNRIGHFKLQLKLGEYTDALNRGEACPLCGSLEHIAVLKITDVNKQLTSEEEILAKKRKDLYQLQELQNSFRIHEKELELYNKNLKEADLNLQDFQQKTSEHKSLFIWDKFSPTNANEVVEQLENVELIRKKLDQLNAESSLNEEALEKTSTDYNRFAEKLSELKQDLGSKKTEFTVFAKQLKHHREEELENLALVNLHEQSRVLQEKIIRDRELYEKLNKELSSTNEELFKCKTRLDSFENRIKEVQTTLENLNNSLKDKLEKSNFNNWQSVHELLASTVEIEKEKENVHQYHLKMYSEKGKLKDLQSQTEDKVFEGEYFISLTEETLKSENEITRLNEEYFGESSLLKSWISQLTEKIKLEKELEKLEARAENIKTMRQLFTANGFVNYISTVYLQNLCQIANERFYQLTRQQLQLELGDKNEFLVRDFMNDGKLRSVKTLSGGQTFQASLCLALALAESVQQLNKSKQNFFFLDEGFGSLDKESLEMAFETLKALRKENRMVGIISHVEELQQEIEVYLKVVNDSLTGSEITRSWE